MKTLISAFLLAAASLSLGACGQQENGNVTNGLPGGAGSMTVRNAKLVLPPVAGNPAAVYFDLSNDGIDPKTISSVSVEGAEMAMMHDVIDEDGVKRMVAMEPLTLELGDSVSFERGGKHVMAMKLDGNVKAGDSVEVTLSFANGEALPFQAEVVAAGQAE